MCIKILEAIFLYPEDEAHCNYTQLLERQNPVPPVEFQALTGLC